MRSAERYHYSSQTRKALLANSVAVFLFAIMPILRYFFNEGSGSYGSYPVTVVQYLLLGTFIFLLPHLYQNRALLPAKRICTCLIAFVFLYLLIGYAGIETYPLQYSQKYLQWQKEITVFPFAVGYFVFGVLCGVYKNERLISAAFVLQLGFVLVFIGVPQIISGIPITEYNDKIDYQYWGDGFAFLALMFVTSRRAPITLILSALLAVVVLFLIPSRSSLICGTLAISVYLFMRFRSAALALGAFVAGFALFFLIGLGNDVNLAEYVKDHAFSRQTYFLIEGEDSSLNKRLDYSLTGLETISQHPFLGQYGYYIEKYDEPGTYMHNAMDIWAQAGIVPFLIFTMFIVMAWRQVLSKKQLTSYNHRLTGISILVFSIASLFLARNHGSIHILFGIGAGVGTAVLKCYAVNAITTRPMTFRRFAAH